MGFQILSMEAELMNQSAEGYRFNNIEIIFTEVCFLFVCLFVCLQRTAL